MINNKRKSEFIQNFGPMGKKAFRFGGSANWCSSENGINDMSGQQNTCKGRPFPLPPGFWSPPPHRGKQSPMASVFNYPPFGYPKQMSSPQNNHFKGNPDSRPVYESRDWNPMEGWHYRSAPHSDTVSTDLSEIVFQLRRTTDSLKSEMRAIRDAAELSNRQLIEAIKESNNDLKNSLIEVLKECKTHPNNSQPVQSILKTE